MEAPNTLPRPSWRLNDVSLGSDEGCTGFPDRLGPWDWSACCLSHDAGGTDGMLLDCLVNATPGVPAVLCVLAVFLMALFRPVYNLGQRWGWWR
jgi:hypothetical protein